MTNIEIGAAAAAGVLALWLAVDLVSFAGRQRRERRRRLAEAERDRQRMIALLKDEIDYQRTAWRHGLVNVPDACQRIRSARRTLAVLEGRANKRDTELTGAEP